MLNSRLRDYFLDLELFIFLLCGTMGGFVSSSPLGPINLVVVNRVLGNDKQNTYLFSLLLGVVTADVIYGLLAAFGFHSLPVDTVYQNYLKIAGACLLVGMGVLGLASSRKEFAERNVGNDDLKSVSKWMRLISKRFGRTSMRFKDFCLGLLLCGSNPGFLLWWIYMVQQVSNKFNLQISTYSACAFGAGIFLGDIAWFSCLIKLTKKATRRVGNGWLKWLRLVMAILFLAAGLAGIII